MLDWRLLIGQTVRIKPTGRHGTIIARGDEANTFVVAVPGVGRRCYHVGDLEPTVKVRER